MVCRTGETEASYEMKAPSFGRRRPALAERCRAGAAPRRSCVVLLKMPVPGSCVALLKTRARAPAILVYSRREGLSVFPAVAVGRRFV